MQNTCWLNLNLQLLPGPCSLPSWAVQTCLDPAGKGSDKTQTDQVPQVWTVPASSGAAPGRLHLAVLTQFPSAPPPICSQINPTGEMEGWECCSSSLPRDTSSASLLFPQGRGRPAGSKSAAGFPNLHLTLPPMPLPHDHLQAHPSNASKQQLSKNISFPAKSSTGLSVELVAGCWGAQGYKRIWREMRYNFISAAFSGYSPGWSGGSLKEV